MLITIWQQFSSNHSASFEIVGKFRTEQEAHAAADELRQIVERMVRWWKENEAEDWEHNLKRNEITPIEQQIRDEYGIEWAGNSLIWDQKHHKLPIDVVGRYMFVSNWYGWEAGTGPRPFTDLLEAFGGYITFEADGTHANPHGSMSIEITFTAPDEQTGG